MMCWLFGHDFVPGPAAGQMHCFSCGRVIGDPQWVIPMGKKAKKPGGQR